MNKDLISAYSKARNHEASCKDCARRHCDVFRALWAMVQQVKLKKDK